MILVPKKQVTSPGAEGRTSVASTCPPACTACPKTSRGPMASCSSTPSYIRI
ncbi:hypothetical protein ACWCRD_05730 [Streptomyces sp. NPDC002092]